MRRKRIIGCSLMVMAVLVFILFGVAFDDAKGKETVKEDGNSLTATPKMTVRPTEESMEIPEVTKAAQTEVTRMPVVTTEEIPTANPTTEPESTETSEQKGELVEFGYYDKNIIPDKFNTGCYDTSVLEKINSACVVDGVAYTLGDNGSTVVIDLYYKKVNRELPKEVVIRNKDFSDMNFAIRHIEMIETEKIICFENCVFGYAGLGSQKNIVSFHFVDCSFERFYGSNASFDRCFFGGSANDGMNPFQNITVKNCYFAGYSQWNEKGVHTDAVQIYGKKGVMLDNILFKNCRIENPIVNGKKRKSGYINSCLMVALEYSNARDFLLEDCIINGGGYSIYATDNGGEWELNNIIFRNISLGDGHLYGDIYPKVADGVVFENIHDTKKLYVASVWKDFEGKIHLSVSNDTAEDRTLLIVTESGKQAFTIPSKATSEAAGATEYSDLAIDMEVVPLDANSDWVICYDGEETKANQIRYVNWSGEMVYRCFE